MRGFSWTEPGGKRVAGRAYLVAKLREHGLSKRRATRILDTIITEMIGALKRGREVEFPFGKLQRVKKHFSRSWDEHDDWPANRQLYTAEHETDLAGERLLSGKPVSDSVRKSVP
jgi:hypothetical protein